MSAIVRATDLIYTFRFLHLLTTPWKEMAAYELGLIDENGKTIKKAKTPEEKSAFTLFHRLVFNVKRLLGMVPLGKTRIASYAAALYLLKEAGAREDDIRAVMRTEPGITLDENLLRESTDSWTMFPPESGSKNIPRKHMPQIAKAHRGALTQFLLGKGITHRQAEVVPSILKPTQQEYSQAKVQQMKDSDDQRAILVSSDNHVLDGHHQWVAALHYSPGELIRIIQFDCPIRDLINHTKEFPSAFVSESWFVKDGNLLPGNYELTMPVPAISTLDLVGEAGSKIFVAEESKPIGEILGISLYHVVHAESGQKLLVSADNLTK